MTLNSAEKPHSDLQIKPSIHRGFESQCESISVSIMRE
ncbi:hypothetical protein COLO4_20579 [Corchorus olitorius]|uniref:Uncharacterized protein n=1 Tax=Corchorus olitorius TaxID=93759 RepID=A0A1R3IYV2_9ROSI|nr:hypothetical protein COLO4_20579 [Corchorus olitorius]